MDILDVIIIVVVVLAAVHGVRLGAAVQVLSFVGAILGAAIGIALLSQVSSHLHDPFTRTFVALLCLLVPTSLLWGAGRQIGTRIWRRLHGHAIAAVDSATGAVVAMGGALVVMWLLASMLAQSQVGTVSRQIENSAVLHAVTDVMPGLPNELATVERQLNDDGFSFGYLGILPPTGPVALPSAPAVRAAVLGDGASTVRIIAEGCVGVVQEGSGFVVAPDLVATNAHVIAGTSQISVDYGGAQSVAATPVFFDPNFDLAVLRANVPEPPLRLAPGYASRGTKATVLGYPGGETFLNAQPAGVLLRFDPVSTNIYGTTSVQRQIYEIRSLVRPGNSGGPLVEPGGAVIGIVFSRASNENRVGFALASPGVRARVLLAERRPAGSIASTGACTDS
jgi:S1-C subfamily serine protease